MRTKHETNLWSTHVNIVRLAEPIRRCVRWRTQVFKIEGFVCKRFLPFPPPPPSFTFWLSFHFSRGQNRKSPSSVFLCSETKRKRLPRRLQSLSTTTVPFRATFTRTIIKLNLLLKWLPGSNLSHKSYYRYFVEKSKCHKMSPLDSFPLKFRV